MLYLTTRTKNSPMLQWFILIVFRKFSEFWTPNPSRAFPGRSCDEKDVDSERVLIVTQHIYPSQDMNFWQASCWQLTVCPWPPDLTSRPPNLVFYWSGLATKNQSHFSKNKNWNFFEILISGAIFGYGPPKFDPAHLNLWVTGPDGSPTFKT